MAATLFLMNDGDECVSDGNNDTIDCNDTITRLAISFETPRLSSPTATLPASNLTHAKRESDYPLL
jgi:hypothetical protein